VNALKQINMEKIQIATLNISRKARKHKRAKKKKKKRRSKWPR
jgi:hypothetical protein